MLQNSTSYLAYGNINLVDSYNPYATSYVPIDVTTMTFQEKLKEGRRHWYAGYFYWQHDGKYNAAIAAFKQAIAPFKEVCAIDDIIASYLNIGNIYALYGAEFRALRLIRNAIELSEVHKNIVGEIQGYIALGDALNSFGYITYALKHIEHANRLCYTTQIKKDIAGLALLVKGRLYRKLVEMRHHEHNTSLKITHTNITQSEHDLKTALDIFTGMQDTSLYVLWALNELACCYRAYYLFLLDQEESKIKKARVFSKATLYFDKVIDMAHTYAWPVQELDSLQDLAVLHMMIPENSNIVQKIVRKIKKRIPDVYKIEHCRCYCFIDNIERVPIYYKLLGQLHLLEGALVAATQQGSDSTDDRLIAAAKHYLFSMTYFNMYANNNFEKRLTYSRIYERFQYCKMDIIDTICKQHIPQWVREYNLSSEIVAELIHNIFELV